ncbi:MIP/aquaporin family protein [uncultured Vibrio sp.]|uniref:MIP/aquaporin family protein n=1 Tax=Vibrio sp. TaxID=678 RepID=UPI002AA6AB92|nr:MIP/aquaporin family protein [uncultured Vibrio sp.]
MDKKLRGQCIAEFFGTGLFIFFGAGCLCATILAGADFGLWEIAIVWGLGIALAVYLTAGISGAHLNPAVTLGLFLFASFEKRKVLPYIIAQTAGAFFGATVCYFIYQNLFSDYETAHNIVRGSQESLALAGIFTTFPHPSISVFHAAIVEIILTATLMSLILSLTDDGNGVPKGALAPLLIGILVAVIGAAAAPLTGFAMNPARDFGPRLFTFFAGWGEMTLTGARDIPYLIVPIVAPLIGACIGGAGYRYLIDQYVAKPSSEVQNAESESAS